MISPYPPERDGIGVFCKLLGDALSADGYKVAIVSARPSPDPEPETIGHLPRAVARDVSPALATAASFSPDLVHVQFAVAAYGARVLNLLRVIRSLRRRGVPVVITMHEVTRDIESLRRPGELLYRHVAGLADRIIVHTPAAHAKLVGELGADDRLVEMIPLPQPELPAGIDEPTLRDRHSLGSERVVLSFGFIDVDKGLDDLVRAVGKLRAAGDFADARLVVAGAVRRRFGIFRIFELRDTFHLQAVKRLIVSLGLEGQVELTGYVPRDEVRSWFETATVTVLPYRRSEHSGVASLARGSGAPLLTTDVGDLASVSSFAPFAPRDVAALADRLREALGGAPVAPSQSVHSDDLPDVAMRTAGIYASIAGAVRSEVP